MDASASASHATTFHSATSSFYADRRKDKRRAKIKAETPFVLGIVPGPRYVLHPGYGHRTQNDVEEFLSAPQLAKLYGIAYRGCLVAGDHYQPMPGDIHFYPRADGHYEDAVGAPGCWFDGIAVAVIPPK